MVHTKQLIIFLAYFLLDSLYRSTQSIHFADEIQNS